ncbi:hypothetical protein [Streptomyces griseus]|uniref:hypothetical protein n=1 Tax=Streptomyces griseus TaxID=1911 RepID=UPI003700D25C
MNPWHGATATDTLDPFTEDGAEILENGRGGEDGQEIDQNLEGFLIVVWLAVGVSVGMALSLKYVESIGFGPDDTLPWGKGIVMLLCMAGPPALSFMIGDKLHTEISKGKITWSAYWVTLCTLAVPAFSFVGISDVEDLFQLWERV